MTGATFIIGVGLCIFIAGWASDDGWPLVLLGALLAAAGIVGGMA